MQSSRKASAAIVCLMSLYAAHLSIALLFLFSAFLYPASALASFPLPLHFLLCSVSSYPIPLYEDLVLFPSH